MTEPKRTNPVAVIIGAAVSALIVTACVAAMIRLAAWAVG